MIIGRHQDRRRTQGYFGADSDDDGGFRYPAAKTTKLRARQHPRARVARRFSAEPLRSGCRRTRPTNNAVERVWDIQRTTEEVVAELKEGQRGRRGHEAMGRGVRPGVVDLRARRFAVCGVFTHFTFRSEFVGTPLKFVV